MYISRAAIACIGGMYEKLGRMVGRSYEETVSLLVKALKNAEVCLCISFEFIVISCGIRRNFISRLDVHVTCWMLSSHMDKNGGS